MLAFICLLFNDPVALSAPGNQGQVDTVAFRTALPAPGLVTGIADNKAMMGAASYPRELLNWIALDGPDRVPPAGPELNRVDVVQLLTGGQVLGRVVSMSRDEVTIDTGRPQPIPFSQVSAVLFCDAPCLVAPGVPVDPLVLATEAARLSAAGANFASAPAPPPPAAPAAPALLVEDPLAALRAQVQAAAPTNPPTPAVALIPATAPIPTVLPTPLPPPPAPQIGVIAKPTNTSGPLFPVPLPLTPVLTTP